MQTSAPRLSSRRRVLALALGLIAAPAFGQQRIAGQAFSDTARVAGAELVLNGVGVRAVAWLQGFAAGLYLGTRATTAAQALATPGAKRLQMRMLQDVPPAEFVKAIDKGVARNTPAAEQPGLAGRQAQFGAQVMALGTVKKGDTVDLDFDPRRGLLLAVNGKTRGDAIAGEDFYAAVLRIFLGDRPVDPRLKTGLLGGASS